MFWKLRKKKECNKKLGNKNVIKKKFNKKNCSDN